MEPSDRTPMQDPWTVVAMSPKALVRGSTDQLAERRLSLLHGLAHVFAEGSVQEARAKDAIAELNAAMVPQKETGSDS